MATAVLNHYWYGSPFRSGYEPLDVMFAWANVAPNIRLYGASLVSSQTVLAVAGLAAWFVPSRWVGLEPHHRAAQGLSAAVVFVTWAEYCAYTVFGPWWYLRFLLPVWPLMMLGLGLIVLRLIHTRPAIWQLVAAVFVIALGLYTLRWTVHQETFAFKRGEYKYVTAATIARTVTDRNAVVFSGQHSGSLRYYGGRMTVAYFNVWTAHFEEALAWITSRGGHPYALLEKWEVDEFRRRFGTRPPIGLLPMKPLVVYHGPETIYLFDLLQAPDSPRQTYDMPEMPLPADCAKPVPPPRLVLR